MVKQIRNNSPIARWSRWAWFVAIFAAFCGHCVVVEWDANPEPSVAGYRVYWGTQSRVYDSVVDVGNATLAQLATPALKTFYAVTAYDTNGMESDFSDEVSYTPPPQNHPPTVTADAYSALNNQTLTVPDELGVLANDSDVDGDALTVIPIDTVQHGTLTLEVSGAFSYAAAIGFTGTDTFSYCVTDGKSTSSVATVTLLISDPNARTNNPPIAAPDSYATTNNQSLTVVAATGVLVNDSDVDGNTLSAVLAANPTHGTVTLRLDGGFTYTPASNFTGSDNFSYKASDGQSLSAVVTVTITVNAPPPPPNQVPVTGDDFYITSRNQILSVQAATGLLSNDSDADGDPLAVTIATTPTNGTLMLQGDGSFVYLPTNDFTGVDVFTYRASDGKSTSALAIVSIVVSLPQQISCEACLANLEAALAPRAQLLAAIHSLKLPTNGTCLELTVAAFGTIARALGPNEDDLVRAALASAAECIAGNLESQLDALDQRAMTLAGSHWTTFASNRTASARQQLARLETNATPLICARAFSTVTTSIKRVEQSIISGDLAPPTLAGETFEWKRSRTETWRIVFNADGFTVQTLDGNPVVQGSYGYTRTSWNAAQMLMVFADPTLGPAPGEVMTTKLKFSRTTCRMAGMLKGTLRRVP